MSSSVRSLFSLAARDSASCDPTIATRLNKSVSYNNRIESMQQQRVHDEQLAKEIVRVSSARPRISMRPVLSTNFRSDPNFAQPVGSPPILRARLTVSTVTLLARLTSYVPIYFVNRRSFADRFTVSVCPLSAVPCPVTGLSDAPSPATNAGLIFIRLQRRAVSPPRLSMALAPCVAYRHQTLLPSSQPLRPLSLRYSLSLRSMCTLSLPSPFAGRRSRSPLSGPYPCIVGWYGIPCGTSPFRRSRRPFPLLVSPL